MALPTGLVPVTAFVLTIGTAIPVTLGAHLFHRNGNGSFSAALRSAFAEASLLYLVGALVVWSIAGGLALWEVAATLLVTGFVALIVLAAIPLFVGRLLVRRVGGVDSGTALRYATYGWPAAMLAVFGIFIAPGGLATNVLFSLGGERICLAGHCGIALWFAVAVVLELLVAVLGPGLVGLAIASSSATHGREARS